jgi:uncharacterized protein (TIGR00730 family)
MRRICVFCGSSPGLTPAYADGARRLAEALVEANITLVYGGAHLGLMGILADAMLATGGEVIGVIPRSLQDQEIAHTGLTDLRIVGSMHERKALMAELADGFIALPGGLGTLEEFFEVLTWAQLSIHRKPCGLLDLDGFYAPLLLLMDHMVQQRFLRPEHRSMILVEPEPRALLARFAEYRAPAPTKWVDRSII